METSSQLAQSQKSSDDLAASSRNNSVAEILVQECTPSDAREGSFGSVAHTPASNHIFTDFIDSGYLTLEEAEHLFRAYQRDFMSEFPFVTVLPTESFLKARRDRPILLEAILAVALVHDPSTQRKLGRHFSHEVHTRMMSQANYPLDLLQVLLVFIAFYQYFFHPTTQEYFMLVNFCITLVHEIGLDGNLNDARENMIIHRDECTTSKFPARRAEAHRALLGTFYLSSSSVLPTLNVRSFATISA